MNVLISILVLIKYSYASRAGSSWDYDHMADWAHDFSMCGLDDESPINIQSAEVIYDSNICSPVLNWTINWSQHLYKINNNGHSVVLKAVKKIDLDTTDEDVEQIVYDSEGQAYMTLTLNENSIARLPNYFLPENSPHSEFCLDSFHFHWGLENDEGSEHLINDYQYPMEVHFVHYSCEHASLGTTLSQYPSYENISKARAAGHDTHELAVVGIFFDITDYDNPAFDAILSEEILEHIQYPLDDAGMQAEEVLSGLYLQDIIPEEVFTSGYYAYKGSLTTPPCTDIVRWHVSNARSYIGKAQIARFRELMYTANQTMAPNYRDPQININPVYGCMHYVEESDRDIITTGIVSGWAVIVLVMMCCLGGICYLRSIREAKLVAVDNEKTLKAKRQRLMSKSSIDRSAVESSKH